MNEVYKLTFEHYIVDNDGKKVNIDEPISTQYVVFMKDGISIPTVLNSMIERMRNYLLEIENESNIIDRFPCYNRYTLK